MNIDTKRLAKDRAYWDGLAPEGATHYDPEDIDDPWMMETTSNWMFYWGSRKEWVGYARKTVLTGILARLVIRPDAQKEWDGTGLPPAGTECEVDDVDQGWIMKDYRLVLGSLEEVLESALKEGKHVH